MRALILLFLASLAIDAAALPRQASAKDSATLRVCADPNNLPFSNAAGEGFETSSPHS